MLLDLIGQIPALMAQLPRQIILGDLNLSNILVDAGRVTGMVDFEFSGRDWRAMDLAVGLVGFGNAGRNASVVWECVDAFAAGYQRRVALEPVESASLLTMLRLREATNLLHRIGRS